MQEKRNFADYAPFLAFIISFFLMNLLDWMEATRFLLAACVGVLTYGLMVADLKMEYKGRNWNFRKLHFYVGLLTLLLIMIFAQGFLHWGRLISSFARMSVLYAFVLLYLLVLFMAIRQYSRQKQKMMQKKK